MTSVCTGALVLAAPGCSRAAGDDALGLLDSLALVRRASRC